MKKQKLCFLASPQDSRIWEVESVLCKPRAEIRLGCLSHKRGAEIDDSSPKAESTNQERNKI